MDIQVELITENPFTVFPEDFFRLELSVAQHPIPLSAGSAIYSCSKTVMESVVATSPITIPDEDLPQVRVKLYTNKVLNQAELIRCFGLRIHLGQSFHDIMLARPDIPVYWEERGTFIIPLLFFN